eukprot:CAMPEP_0177633582 /NCGR_PEP_ID=MMETSP0447-20121125/2915_1 /TAXON_ID=0 /ORGANISM="Stygamoeba regulata, Strain BSH-02190019" /LENGTH=465 /DNA_ID=CAMNT_0019135253 /DNA_START=116 /DNA_END=1511 /DNA_ORIENTATION=+
MKLKAEVVATSEAKAKGKVYTVYHISINFDGQQWQTTRRYKEFHTLYIDLKKRFHAQMHDISFPEKKLINNMSKKVVEKRRTLLDQMMRACSSSPEIIEYQKFRTFLLLDQHTGATAPPAVGEDEEAAKQQFARALYDFIGRNEDELSLRAGEIVTVLDPNNNNGWIYGQSHGETGYFPTNYVEMLEEVPEGMDKPSGGSAPAVPKPILPAQLNDDEKEKRRTMLLDQLGIQAVQQSIAQQKAASAVQTTPAAARAPAQVATPVGGPAPSDGITAKVLYDFVGESSYELTLRAGDIVQVLSSEDEAGDGWWQGSVNGQIGYFPGNYVQVIEPAQRSSSPMPRDTGASSGVVAAAGGPAVHALTPVASEAKLKCILCVCEDWAPFPDMPNLCKHCRHVSKMHRADSCRPAVPAPLDDLRDECVRTARAHITAWDQRFLACCPCGALATLARASGHGGSMAVCSLYV